MMLARAPRKERRLRLSPAVLDQVKAQAQLVALAEAGGVVMDFRRSRPGSGDYWALCPFHAEKTASLHLVERPPRPWFKCHGCGAKGDAIGFVRRLHGVGFREGVRIIGGDLDASGPSQEVIEARERRARELEAEHNRQRAMNRAAAVAIWEAAEPIAGTIVTRYLRSARRVAGHLGGADLRFHPAAPLKPYDPAKAAKRPAMVARIVNAAGEHLGSHLTFLARDGSDKLYREGSRIVCGEHVGGFIRLGHVRREAIMGEGIETTLSASDAFGLPGLAAINSANMRVVALPETVRRVVIAFDRDRKGVGQLSAEALAERLWADGVKVELAAPPAEFKDWNDAAKAGALPKRREVA